MSTFYTRQITCPACRAPIDAWLARGVHATRRDDLRDEILARKFHRRVCGACQLALEIEQHVVYTDFARHQWLYVATERDRADWPAWEARLLADIAQVFSEHSPLVHGIGDQLRSRVVFGYEELREKLVIWEAGFEDALVECAKVRAIAADPTLGLPDTRLVVDRIAPDDRVELLQFAHGAVVPARRVQIDPAWMTDTDRDRASLALRFPELFAGGYVNLRRLLTPSRLASPGIDAGRI